MDWRSSLVMSTAALPRMRPAVTLYRSGPSPRSYSLKASIFHASPAPQASTRPSMFERSAIANVWPSAATRQPRTDMEQRSDTFTQIRSSQSALIALIVIACTSSSNQSGVRGRFCGWKMRPASRPVRAAPQNCSVPRRRPSEQTAPSRALYLLGLVAAACWRISSSSRTWGSSVPSRSTCATVPLAMSAVSKSRASRR